MALGPRMELFTTRVARRIVVLFAVVAVVPVVIMGALSLNRVSNQLKEASDRRLDQVAETLGQTLLERLQLLETRLRVLASLEDPAGLGEAARTGLDAAVRVEGEGDVETLWGPPFDAPRLSETEAGYLDPSAAPGDPGGILRTTPAGEVLIGVPAHGGGVVWGRADGDFLWSTAQRYAGLPTLAAFCVLEGERPLFCDSPVAETMVAELAASGGPGRRGRFAWESRDREYLGTYWEVFLGGSFQADSWTVVVSEDEDLVYSEMAFFRIDFPLALLSALAAVVLVASVQVRRSVEPLEELREGTRRVGEGHFDEPVDIASGDEFEELADAFNFMGYRLALQFRQLEAARTIDRAVLSSLEPGHVVDALLRHFERVVPCRSTGVLLLEAGEAAGELRWSGDASSPRRVELAEQDVATLRRHARSALTGGPEVLPPALAVRPDGEEPLRVMLLPVLIRREVSGAILAVRSEPFYEDEVERGRQIADQAGVALSGARLVAELEEMSWGTLRALARAIDAKSAWTGGHSERVTRLAVALGRRLGLPDEEIDRLQRGGLLHDLGKVGVPADILDRPGTLNDEEMQVMREHVTIGATILEPVRAFQDVVPLVLQHHERWDGSGYPAGLAGHDIHHLARILAVADTFDALASARPYRGAMARDTVVSFIAREAGTSFDPEVVEALVSLHAEQHLDAVDVAVDEADLEPAGGAPAPEVSGV